MQTLDQTYNHQRRADAVNAPPQRLVDAIAAMTLLSGEMARMLTAADLSTLRPSDTLLTATIIDEIGAIGRKIVIASAVAKVALADVIL